MPDIIVHVRPWCLPAMKLPKSLALLAAIESSPLTWNTIATDPMLAGASLSDASQPAAYVF